MATLTPLALEHAQAIGSLFGMDVVSTNGIQAGSVNSNYKLELAGGGLVFLRIYEEQRAETASLEARMLEHLSTRGVPTPRPIERKDGALLAEHQGKPVILFPWVDGETLCQRLVTPERMSRVGEALAQVHVAGASYEGAPASRFSEADLEARLESLPWSTLDAELRGAATELRRRLRERPPRAPESLRVIHADLFRDNVLWQDDAIAALLDFESASRGSAAFDLGVTLLAWCFTDDLDRDLARALMRGYCGVRPLDDEDRAHLFSEASFAALRFAITRITDFELRPRGSGVYKDYRRFLGRGRALDRLGPEGLLTFLGL